MTRTLIDFDAFYRAWQEDLPSICVGTTPQELPCGGEPVSTDRLGNGWCEECRYRGEFLDWGYAHNWPALSYEEYALSADRLHWVLTVLFGTEDRVLALVAATDQFERSKRR